MVLHREPGSQGPMLPVTAHALFPATDLAVDTNPNWYPNPAPIIPSNPLRLAFSNRTNTPVRDATAGEEGIILDQGVYLIRLQADGGDSSGGGGNAGTIQLAVVRKDPAVAADRFIIGAVKPYAAVAASTTSARQATDVWIDEEAIVPIAEHDTVIQLVGRTASAAPAQGAIRSARLFITKLGNYPEAV